VIPGLVLIGDKEIRFHSASYDIRYFVGGQAKYLPAGNNAADAEELRAKMVQQFSAKAIADAAGLKTTCDIQRKTIKQAGTEYCKTRLRELGKDQIRAYRLVMRLFNEACPKVYVDQIEKGDLAKFIDHVSVLPVLRDQRRKLSQRCKAVQRRKRKPTKPRIVSPRTVFNYYTLLCKWLKDIGVDPKIFPEYPKFEEPEITIYSAEQIDTLFSLLTGSLRIAIGLMLKCGLRLREVAFLFFSDIDFERKILVVRGKPELGYHVKNYSQRQVPIPADLFEELVEWKASHPGQTLIVPTTKGNPNTRLIVQLKRFVYLHGLRCGLCEHCRSGNPECEDWELHKFRRTYATALVRHVDLRTAQRYLGHKRITSTERYLRAASAVDGQRKVSQIDFTKPFYSDSPQRGGSAERTATFHESTMHV
jgi:integrase